MFGINKAPKTPERKVIYDMSQAELEHQLEQTRQAMKVFNSVPASGKTPTFSGDKSGIAFMEEVETEVLKLLEEKFGVSREEALAKANEAIKGR